MANSHHLESELLGDEASAPPLDPAGSAEPAPGELFTPWPAWLGHTLDIVALVLALALAVCVIGDLDLPGRPALALITMVSAPGWALVRSFGAPAGALSALGAVGLSVALTIIGGQLCVTLLGWAWRPTVAVVLGATVALSAARIVRGRAGR